MSSVMRLWGRPTSTCTQRVLWAAAEAGVEVELTLASATMGEDGPVGLGHSPFGVVDTDAYRAINPNGTVPTLQEGDFILWDSLAILVYLASRPGPLWLEGAAAMAHAVQWIAWCNEYLDPPLHALVMHVERLPLVDRDAGQIAAAGSAVIRPLQILDDRLARNTYLAGPGFTVADIPAAIAVHRLALLTREISLPPHVAAWRSRLSERQSFNRYVAPRHLHRSG